MKKMIHSEYLSAKIVAEPAQADTCLRVSGKNTEEDKKEKLNKGNQDLKNGNAGQEKFFLVLQRVQGKRFMDSLALQKQEFKNGLEDRKREEQEANSMEFISSPLCVRSCFPV